MDLTKIYDGKFTHADTVAGAAGTTTAILDKVSVGTANAWTDIGGGAWSIKSNNLTGTGSYQNGFLARPTSEGTGDQGITAISPTTGMPSGTMMGPTVRYSAGTVGGNGYYGELDQGIIFLYKNTNGGASQLGSPLAFTFVSTSQYSFNSTVVGNTITLTLADLTTPTNGPWNLVYTDSSSPFVSGVPALDLNTASTIAQVQVFQPGSTTGGTTTPTATASFTLSPATVPPSTTTTVTATGTGTAWTSSTVFSVTGPLGSSIASKTVASATSATLQVVSGPRAGNEVISDGSITVALPIVFPVTVKLCFDGNSLTAGVNASSGQGTVTGTTYPAQVCAALGPAYAGANHGIPGQTTANMIANAANVDAEIVQGIENILIYEGGTNDGGQGVVTPAQAYANLKTYAAARRAAGWNKLIIVPITPASHPSYPANFNSAFRTPFNALILAGWKTDNLADAIADTTVDYRIGQNGDDRDPTYFSSTDFTHLTDLGYGIVAGYVAAEVGELMAPGGTSATTGGTTTTTTGGGTVLTTAQLGVLNTIASGIAKAAAMAPPSTGSYPAFDASQSIANFLWEEFYQIFPTTLRNELASDAALAVMAILPTGTTIDAATLGAVLKVPQLVAAASNLIATQGITLPSGVVAGVPSQSRIPTTGVNPNGLTNYGKGQPLLFQSGTLYGLHQMILASEYIPPTATNPSVTTFIVASFPAAPAVGDTFIIG